MIPGPRLSNKHGLPAQLVSDMTTKSTADLWSDYLFLTRQMDKFISKQNYDMFLELARQRESLQELIDQRQDHDYKTTAEGRKILADIKYDNQMIMNKLRIFLNRAKQEETLNQAYDPYITARQVGGWMDKQL